MKGKEAGTHISRADNEKSLESRLCCSLGTAPGSTRRQRRAITFQTSRVRLHSRSTMKKDNTAQILLLLKPIVRFWFNRHQQPLCAREWFTPRRSVKLHRLNMFIIIPNYLSTGSLVAGFGGLEASGWRQRTSQLHNSGRARCIISNR